MNVEAAYSKWSEIYDTNANLTRDLEGTVCRDFLSQKNFNHVLEMGCGTGKNTAWLQSQCKQITAVDLTQSMLDIAVTKVQASHVKFVQCDMLQQPWPFHDTYDLVTFSLVLEHVEDLTPIFASVDALLQSGGQVYIGELHPFKQYIGSKARYENENGDIQEVTAYTHHTSDFVSAAFAQGWALERMDERFDEGNTNMPRILALLFRKL